MPIRSAAQLPHQVRFGVGKGVLLRVGRQVLTGVVGQGAAVVGDGPLEQVDLRIAPVRVAAASTRPIRPPVAVDRIARQEPGSSPDHHVTVPSWGDADTRRVNLIGP
jgi:hypothetical protein